MPTSGEWQAIYDGWFNSSNKSTTEPSVSKNFAKDLKLPPVGYRQYDNLQFYNRGYQSYYWSSTKRYAGRYYRLIVNQSSVSYNNELGSSYGLPVRCLLNS